MVLIASKQTASKQKKSSKSKSHKRLQAFKRKLDENAGEFFKNTSLQGLKYVVNKELHPLERLYFGLAFVIIVGCSFYFTIDVMSKWSRTPVIFGSNTIPTYITDEPFPAVTICNLNVAVKSKAETYSIYSTEYAMLQMLCKRDVNVSVADTITNWDHVRSFVTKISQPCKNMLYYCEYGGRAFECADLFVSTVTDEGRCCIFNGLHPFFLFNTRGLKFANATNDAKVVHVPWTPQNGYPSELPEHFSPFKAAGVGETLGLRLILDVQSHEYYCSTSSSFGFKILLHNPTERASLHEVGLLLAPGYETKIQINPEKYDSDATLNSVRPSLRQCLFEDEEKLLLFKHYNRRNCESECFTNKSIRICDCVPYFAVKPYENVSTCSLYDLHCINYITSSSADCSRRCLPGCFESTYYPGFFSSPLKLYGFLVSNQFLDNFNSTYAEKNIAVVNMYFKESTYRSSRQTEFISGTDVLTSIGGLIGLFFGSSFISLAEIVFFALIRPFRRTRNLHESTQEEKLKRGSIDTNRSEIVSNNSTRGHYKRELGFGNLKNAEDISEAEISQLYMPGEFIKSKQSLTNNHIIEKWYTRKNAFQ